MIALLTVSCHCSGGLQKTPKAPSALVSHMSSATVVLVYTHITMPEVDPDKEVDPDAEPVRPILTIRDYCAGVWISKDTILTARHCVNVAAEIEQVGDPENLVIHYVMDFEAPAPRHEPLGVHIGSVVKVDADNDLALLKATGGEGGKAIPAHEVAMLATQLPGVGEDIWIVGHPKGMFFSTYKGSVAGYRTDTGNRIGFGHWIQVQAPVFYGNSGGGAFDSDGNLIGIASNIALFPSGPFSFGVVPNMGFFVDANAIRAFLKDAK